MPKVDSTKPDGGPSFPGPRYRPNWLAAVLSFGAGVYLAGALFDYDPAQVSGITSTANAAQNAFGRVGAWSVWGLRFMVGGCVWLIPVALLWICYVAVRNSRHLVGTRVTAIIVCVVSMSGILSMAEGYGRNNYYPQGLGGLVGIVLYKKVFADALGTFGSFLLFAITYLCALVFVITKDIGAEFEKIFNAFAEWRAKRAALKEAAAAEALKKKEERAKQRAALGAALSNAPAAPTPVGPTGVKKLVVAKPGEDPLAKAGKPADPPAPAPTLRGEKPPVVPKPPVSAEQKLALTIVKPEEPKKAKVVLPQTVDANYEFPPVKLLKEQVRASAGNSDEEHRQNAENLLRILGEFGVEVSLGEIHVGPVITRYEVVPAPGVRVEKIAGLDKNIALGMRAQSVRILAPIPGKAAVGVEVPNQHPTPVGMREILESEDWVTAKAELPIALGRDVSGKPLISDLSKMPHLLIAGATGSGKSVCINSIITSILYSKSPKDVRLIMVDPKVVELKVFNALPHMFIPVVTEPKKVPAALKWLLGEMELRYQIFAKANVRNIVGFNNRKKDPKGSEQQPNLEGMEPIGDSIEMPEHLPYIVAIIDELADLMMIAPAEIETSIARLAQLARAAGIHLIIATQRPSVNVITGVIKANLPSRIAFQVASQVDSRTILDTKGADTLIGRGDMLFSPPGTSKLVRAQGAFVGDEEVHGIVEFLKKNGPPQYVQAVQQQIDRAASEDDEEDGEGEDGDLGSDEDLYAKALDVLKSTRRASTSMLQRRLRIGYNRAARIMEIMEEKGIVGPENGSSPREILADLDSL
jgi:DNA segregation ATPase FtsK/SpoIIIE, S-DNA-T family